MESRIQRDDTFVDKAYAGYAAGASASKLTRPYSGTQSRVHRRRARGGTYASRPRLTLLRPGPHDPDGLSRRSAGGRIHAGVAAERCVGPTTREHTCPTRPLYRSPEWSTHQSAFARRRARRVKI